MKLDFVIGVLNMKYLKDKLNMYYLKNEYPNNIIIFNQDTDEVVCRMMHFDFKSEELAIEQAEKLVELLNKL